MIDETVYTGCVETALPDAGSAACWSTVPGWSVCGRYGDCGCIDVGCRRGQRIFDGQPDGSRGTVLYVFLFGCPDGHKLQLCDCHGADAQADAAGIYGGDMGGLSGL